MCDCLLFFRCALFIIAAAVASYAANMKNSVAINNKFVFRLPPTAEINIYDKCARKKGVEINSQASENSTAPEN